MAEKNGMSALGLKRQLGVGSYETCWAMQGDAAQVPAASVDRGDVLTA